MRESILPWSMVWASSSGQFHFALCGVWRDAAMLDSSEEATARGDWTLGLTIPIAVGFALHEDIIVGRIVTFCGLDGYVPGPYVHKKWTGKSLEAK
jgi:hypothetical protein